MTIAVLLLTIGSFAASTLSHPPPIPRGSVAFPGLTPRSSSVQHTVLGSGLSKTTLHGSDPSYTLSSPGSVARTIFPGYNTSIPGSFTSSVYSWTVGEPAYNPSTNTVWFPEKAAVLNGFPSPNFAPIAVFNVSAGTFSGFVSGVTNSSAAIYDAGNGLMYVTQPDSNSVLALNSRTGTIVGSPIHVGQDPSALALDPYSNTLFVANSGSGNVSTINVT